MPTLRFGLKSKGHIGLDVYSLFRGTDGLGFSFKRNAVLTVASWQQGKTNVRKPMYIVIINAKLLWQT